MVFNSISFAIFLPCFFIIYFLLNRNLKYQNYFILFSSLFFYGFWDYRFVPLLVFNTVMDYYFGLAIYNQENPRRKGQLMTAAVVMNLGILFFFKYFNFFIDSVQKVSTSMGWYPNIHTLNILLPIGISFYTFHSLSYTIDIYWGKFKPTKDYVAYASFVCFFPQLVAGPISRARDMLPKFLEPRAIDGERMKMGLSQMALGFFKKMVIADGLASMVDLSFANLHVISDFQILLTIFFYTVQIYCDFSGYSDIALGLGKIFGIEFKNNFNRPYFSRNFTEFWQRWHISLSSWLRDYLYIPLGGNRQGVWRTYLNLMITMLLGGLWHGASWNFVIWGALHGIYLVVQRLVNLQLPKLLGICLTFGLTMLTWVFFRSHSLHDSLYILNRITHMSSFKVINFLVLVKLCYLILVLFLLDRYCFNFFEWNNNWSFWLSIILVVHIFLFGVFKSSAFIYFQF